MGTILSSYGDAGYEHEGYAAYVLDDGTITGTYSSSTIPRMTGHVVAACGCGWTGTTRYPCTGGAPFDEHAEELSRRGSRRARSRTAALSAGTAWVCSHSPSASSGWLDGRRNRRSRASPPGRQRPPR